MDDAELVRSTCEGDGLAFTAIFDRYAARVHDLALALLRDRRLAGDVVESVFGEARRRLPGLLEEHRLAVWLLAVTRRHAALRAGPVAGPDRRPTLPGLDPEQDRLANLVWEAVGDLPLRDRTLIELSLRQGLEGQDLADALGVSVADARQLETEMRVPIEKGLTGYLVDRSAGGRCPDLTKALKGWDGRFTLKGASLISRHVDGCAVCTQAGFELPSPFALYASALPAAFPASLEAQGLERIVLRIDADARTVRPPSNEAFQEPISAPVIPASTPPAMPEATQPVDRPVPLDAGSSPEAGDPAPPLRSHEVP